MLPWNRYRALEARVEVLEQESERRAQAITAEVKSLEEMRKVAEAISGEIAGKPLPGRRTAGKGAVARIP
jgi:hypothetical protein